MNEKLRSLLPVILAGGAGTRLWPLSRELFPKQFLTLHGSESFLQATIGRLTGLRVDLPLVICNEEHRFVVAEQLRGMNMLGSNILLEPVGRNTAPAIALAAWNAVRAGIDPVLLVLSADHIVQDPQSFRQAVSSALPLAEQGGLVTFGVVPSGPETGFGYIRRGDAVSDCCYRVAEFVEKPSREVAEKYLASGDYLWNGGMFCFQASRYLEELERYRPDIASACRLASESIRIDMDFLRVDADLFKACADQSIDYAVMEHTSSAYVVPMDAGWSDAGTFGALWQALPRDRSDNAHFGDVVEHDSRGNLIIAENCLVATVGLEDAVVIQTKDAVLVAPRARAHQVKQIVAKLKAGERREVRSHRQVYRPWGHYDSVDAAGRYQVKRITVVPGGKLSLQKHHHRSEHWVVVSGTAQVTVGDECRLLTENQSIYIPVGVTHSLENPGKIPLEIVEVQVGPYLGEDDIVRFQDKYGRS